MSIYYDDHDYEGLVALHERALPDSEVDEMAQRIRWAAENYHTIEPGGRDEFTATGVEMLHSINDELAWQRQATRLH